MLRRPAERVLWPPHSTAEPQSAASALSRSVPSLAWCCTMHSSLALAVLAGAAFASACGDEKHFQRVRRAAASSAAASKTVAAGTSAAAAATAPSRTDEASNAQITNAAEECTPYSYPPVAALVRRSSCFPSNRKRLLTLVNSL